MKKIFFIISLLLIFFNIIGINKTLSFLDSDLGLNLYKNIDKGLEELENVQYSYELRGGNIDSIEKNINRILKEKNISECLDKSIEKEIIEKIANGEINPLIENFKKEEKCGYNENTGKFESMDSKIVGNLISEINKIVKRYKSVGQKKAKAIYEISRIGIYSDGSTKNSSFDVIKDIQDINKIIFTKEIKYNGEDTGFLSDISKEGLENIIYNSPTNLLDNKDENKNGEDKNNLNIPINLKKEEDYLKLNPNNYLCKNYNDNSGLEKDSLNILKKSLANPNIGLSFKYSSGNINLPNTNKIEIPNLNSNEYIKLESNTYNKINDNNYWPCSKFFCISVDFIVNKNDLLGYSKSKSMENFLKTSNKHLKKAMNTSLVQSKMTTNNFEMSLRDIDLPSMLNMGFIITKKSPPILNLEKIKQRKDNTYSQENENEEIKIKLREKYKNLDLDYNQKNNINKFLKIENDFLSIVSSLEKPAYRVERLRNEYKKIIALQAKANEYNESTKSKKINNEILEDFDKEFTELEQFTKNILEYVNEIDILVKKLRDIPTYSG